MGRYIVFLYDEDYRCADYESALSYAAEKIRDQWKDTGELGACFAIVYDLLNRTRVIVWLTDDMKIKYRKLF